MDITRAFLDSDSSFLTAEHWQNIGVKHHHGVCVPLSALISSHSGGIGEYTDLLEFLNWLSHTGASILQLLPLNDTANDPSPYMGVSGFALHPIYLNITTLEGAEKTPQLQAIVSELRSLNTTKRLLYTRVLELKLTALSLYLDNHLPRIEQSVEYQRFVHEHDDWLEPYAIFKALKHVNADRAWWHWENLEPSKTEIRYWKAIQFLCHRQLKKVKEHAEQLGIQIFGDIPILINKDSADCWHHRDLFDLSKNVGAPPDMYNDQGQDWGFPLYRWENHKKDHYQWWKSRLKAHESFYHLFRLDHLVGFFRLWTLPEKRFIPETAAQWQSLGEEILRAIVPSTTMLPIGEDLGDVPDLVRSSMQKLGIPGIKVLRWERKWKEHGQFRTPTSFSPESISTLSTHDSSMMRAWWEEEPESSKQMATDLGLSWQPILLPETLFSLLELCHRSSSLFHINPLNEYLSLFEELCPPKREDRINTPGTTSENNWTYRYVPLETIYSHKALANRLKMLLL